jgi:hypothetical protein
MVFHQVQTNLHLEARHLPQSQVHTNIENGEVMNAHRVLALACLISTTASATTIDFESLPDGALNGNEYASLGVSQISGAIALTSGFSLNEFDFPPASGQVVLGNASTGQSVALTFAQPVDNFSAWLTFGSAVTISSYNASGSLLYSFTTPVANNLGTTSALSIGTSAIDRVVFSSAGDFILDDVHFDAKIVTSIPEPGTYKLMFACLAVLALAVKGRKSA